ncbi:hypothetical protein O2N63_00065 [Aliiroseovarius sp. KMU-50]|uniref:Uncharacterized protein n=1 Tax=Aliiroseovarius salicola TaxID=3009082 RepID=A0ABT4VW58_9RHOB|nr:hypothetical protein [Aliiroseovarius sp. KMU-50]MDA5092483.1 hypothetical protein [Aliiroseovarius sp. KMU-50]
MTVEHYIVFIGANAPLSTELTSMKARIAGACILAPAAKKKQVGATRASISLALRVLVKELYNAGGHSEPARLSLWFYEPETAEQFREVWSTFGHSAWVETVPRNLVNKVRPTREYIENKINDVRPMLHEISAATYASRKSSPLSLPLRNFNSSITRDLKTYWYNDLSSDKLSREIKSLKMRFRQTRDKVREGFKDDKALIFKPAKDTECHGIAHPIGSEEKAFACGRFRYGVALFPGFHYDVTAAKSATIQSDLKTSSGAERSLKSEKRRYINIFPNDHLLPEK